MKTVGIIAEYDPFHCGHAYQLEKAREAADADYVIIAMSPDFLQRGEPALVDKWVRARMALQAGADLVLELPVRSATGSAEFFAQGGVGLLDLLGCVDALSFGCETPDSFALLTQAAQFFIGEEPAGYQAILRARLREGISFPKARAQAFTAVRGGDEVSADEVMAILSQPNNILAIEYLKAALRLKSPMKMIPVRRLGSYHSAGDVSQGFASASAIREALLGHDLTLPARMKGQLPPASLALLEEELRSGRYITAKDLDLFLHRALWDNRDCLQAYVDIDEDLANRIRSCLHAYTGFAQFAALVRSRQYTLTRIRRSLLHVLLGLRKNETPPPCARVLGFRRSAQPLLHQIQQSSSIPLSTSLPFSALPKEDIHAAHLWEMLITGKTGRPLRHEQQRQLIVI